MNQKNNLPESLSEFQDIWDLAKSYSPKEANSNDESWAKLQEKLSNNPSKLSVSNDKPQLKVSYTKWISIAAAITVFAISGLLFFNQKAETFTGEFLTKNNEVKTVELEDGSSIILGANSALSYSISDEKRDIKLNGKARFEVAKDPSKPFTVEFNESRVTVLGTGFDITSYNKNNQHVFVNHGKVKVESANEEIILTKNLGASIHDSHISGFQLPENPMEWNETSIRFKNAELSMVTENLSEFTGKRFSIESSDSKIKFTGSFEFKQKPEEIANIISTALNTKVTVQ
jgi:transmembrane sensor